MAEDPERVAYRLEECVETAGALEVGEREGVVAPDLRDRETPGGECGDRGAPHTMIVARHQVAHRTVAEEEDSCLDAGAPLRLGDPRELLERAEPPRAPA